MGMTPARVLSIVCAALALGGVRVAWADAVIPGSAAFCLYEIPVDDNGKRRWINLGIVQYVEATRAEVKISYGGGNFGSGHEARIPVASMEEAVAMIEKMRKAAAACR
jgi:hypothetical protein